MQPSTKTPPRIKTGTRNLRPRPTYTGPAVVVTDEDAQVYPALGMTARQFREFVVRYHVRHVRDGRRLRVVVEDVVAKLRELAVMSGAAAADESGPLPAVAESDDFNLDEMLRTRGLRRRSA